MIQKLYPNGKAKAFNVTYDDGVLQDIRFVELLNKYNLKLLIHWFKNSFEPSVSEVGGLTKNIINGTVYRTAMGISEEDNTIK